MEPLPLSFRNRIIGAFGQPGQDWLGGLPTLLDRISDQWELHNLQPIPDPSYNYILFATRENGQSVVLKMGVPNPELTSEILALEVFSGKSIVRLLEADQAAGALLLERILPGDDLRIIEDDQEATRIAAQLMRRIWKPVPAGANFPSAGEWCQGFQRYLNVYSNQDSPLPYSMVKEAASLAERLLTDSPESYLLHGDLHHMNILQCAPNDWRIIDPKGVIGEPAFEVEALLANPAPGLIENPHLPIIQAKRLDILEEVLELPRDRMANWGFCRAVLSAIWSVEGGQDGDYGITIAKSIIQNIE
jgi:streptomycin 6-kinase